MKGHLVVVTQTRHTTFWVSADTPNIKEDANALADGIESDEWIDDDFDVEIGSKTADIPSGASYWTGGPEGDWADA